MDILELLNNNQGVIGFFELIIGVLALLGIVGAGTWFILKNRSSQKIATKAKSINQQSQSGNNINSGNIH